MSRKPAYTLKIRGGSETYTKRDGSLGTAGKGPLIQKDKSATLGVTQDQYLFAPVEHFDNYPHGILEEVDRIDT